MASIDIPESVEYIDELAFMKCTSLSSITIPNSVKYVEDAAFKDCTGLKHVNISNSLNFIDEQTFFGCSELTDVTIGEGLSTIAYQAFWGCDKLESVTVLATTPPEFEWGNVAFTHYGTLHVKKGCKEAYSNTLYWENFNIVEDAEASPSGIDEKFYNSAEPASGIYDLQGLRLTSAPEKGIYIKNGRRMIAK